MGLPNPKRNVAMKNLLIAATITLLSSTQVFASEVETKLTLIGGGWSQHHSNDSEFVYNDHHNMIGVMIDDTYVVSRFNNSFYNTSYVVAYNFNLYDFSVGDLEVGFDIAGGLVTGYEKYQLRKAYICDNLGIYVMPSLTASYNISNDFSVGLTMGVLPYKHGIVTTQFVNISYRF